MGLWFLIDNIRHLSKTFYTSVLRTIPFNNSAILH